MKKLLFSLLMMPFMALSLVSCGDDNTSEPTPTDYYRVGYGYTQSLGIPTPPSALISSIKALYDQKMSEICTIQSGCYVTSLKESELTVALQNVEPQAQTIRDQYEWEGEISITVNHHKSDGSETKPYVKYFAKTDPTEYPLEISMEFIDSLCCDLTSQQITTFGLLFNQKRSIKVTGRDSVIDVFMEAKDSVEKIMKNFTTTFSDNQSLVVKYEQKDTAKIITKPAFIIVTRDSSYTATSVTLAKEACQSVYRFTVNTPASVNLWGDYYRPYLETNCSHYASMRYQLKTYTPNVAKSDSIFNAMLIGLESGALTYLTGKTTTTCSIKVDRESIFGKKDNVYTIQFFTAPK